MIIPTKIRNKETIAAMVEAERIGRDSAVKGYNDLDELFSELNDSRGNCSCN